MIDYKLAKQLKEAGFPQGGSGKWLSSIGVLKLEYAKEYDDAVYLPTLAELIEACGKPFVLHSPKSYDVCEEYVCPSMTKWVAFRQNPHTDAEGKSPEEAVAKLYIKLNKGEQD